jgi:hypothetical protein
VSTLFEAATQTPHKLVEFNGKLFRKLGHPNDETTIKLLNQAFQREDERNSPWPFTFESEGVGQKPVSQPLRNQLSHRFYLEGDNRAKELEAWPFVPVITGMRGRRVSRNDFRFEDLCRKLADIDSDEFAKGRAEHAIEAAKLLAIDGVLWIETTPPAICVSMQGHGSTARMVMELMHVPNWLDANLDRQYFPLSEHAAAVEYAERANKLTQTGAVPFEDYTYESHFTAEGSQLLTFDGEAYSCTRTTLILGGDVARWLTYGEGLAEKIGADRTRSVLLARDMAKAIGTDISEWPETEDLVDDVTEAWKLTGRKPGWATIPANRRSFGTMICDRAIGMGKISVFATLATESKP